MAILSLCVLGGCQERGKTDPQALLDAGSDDDEGGNEAGPVSEPPSGLVSRPTLCDRAASDAVRDVFCAEAPAHITSLRELQGALGLNLVPVDLDDASAAALPVPPNSLTGLVVFMGHSSALAGRVVSPINPRVLLLGREVFIAFQRGVQQVELAAIDHDSAQLNLYLLTFRQACNAASAGCSPGDLYTPALERDWASIELHDAEELKNTPADCRQCHQRARETPVLLMRELRGPWTHFFAPAVLDARYKAPAWPTGRDLALDFLAAKGDELYAGMPASVGGHTAGISLQGRVSPAQPIEFESDAIATELTAYDAGAGAPRSATWDKAYQAFKRGEQLPLPHFLQRPTDPAKQAALSDAYQRFRAGDLAAEQLPDLADIFPDDPQVRAELGLSTEPDASAPELLIQACGVCHNDVLDQTISRAHFNIALARMSRDEIELAIERIQRSSDAPGVMPPPDVRQLDAQGRARLLDYLRRDLHSAEDDALLERAAQLGMAQEQP